MRNVARLSIAVGGFLIVSSLILVGVILLVFLNLIEIEVLSSSANISILSLIFIVFGILDFVASLILIMDR
jgi:hypothetical protein